MLFEDQFQNKNSSTSTFLVSLNEFVARLVRMRTEVFVWLGSNVCDSLENGAWPE